jgi:hypothetical protein
MTERTIAPHVEARRRSLQNRSGYESKDLDTAGAPEWAWGCGKCRYGIVRNDLPLGGAVPHYLQRTVQAKDRAIVLCTCQAGQAMRSLLKRTYDATLDRTEYFTGPMLDAARQWTADHTPAPTFNGKAGDD